MEIKNARMSFIMLVCFVKKNLIQAKQIVGSVVKTLWGRHDTKSVFSREPLDSKVRHVTYGKTKTNRHLPNMEEPGKGNSHY